MKLLKIILAADAIRPPLTGIGRYAFELAKGLRNHPAVAEFKLLDRLRWQRDPDVLIKRFSTVDELAGKPRGGPAFLHGAIRSLWRRAAPGVKLARCWPHRDHLFHSPNYALPLFPGRLVSTVHDLSIIRHPEFHPRERVRHLKRIFPSILKRAHLILTDSEFSKTELLDCFDFPEDRIKAIPLGVDARYRLHDPEELSMTLAKHGLRYGEYVLSVGTIEPRKNVERLIKVYGALPRAMRLAYPLVLVGNEGWNSAGIHARIEQGQEEGWLKYLAYINEAELPAIYAGARVFTCVSLYEGFGLPVLEAMASGVAVLCSQVASLPEVGGNAVRYVDPLDSEEIRESMADLLSKDDLRARLAQEGVRQAAQFSWQRTVDQTVDAYRSIG
jgi:glycosyltransferase involved in cell wall biosynthesis